MMLNLEVLKSRWNTEVPVEEHVHK